MTARQAEHETQEWYEIMSTTLDGAFYCAHAAAPYIATAGGGSIVNLGGISADVGTVGRVHAVTANAGMVGLTRALAKELATDNIMVNTMVPGSIETIRSTAAGRQPWPLRVARCMMGRWGQPDEIAAMVRFLCSAEARYVTG